MFDLLAMLLEVLGGMLLACVMTIAVVQSIANYLAKYMVLWVCGRVNKLIKLRK